jgi:hypothetical protein
MDELILGMARSAELRDRGGLTCRLRYAGSTPTSKPLGTTNAAGWIRRLLAAGSNAFRLISQVARPALNFSKL